MKTKTKTKKKIFVINLGDVRDVDWELKASQGLSLLKKIREADFKASTEAPYISGGDVPLLITVEMKGSSYKIKKDIKILKSIVGGATTGAGIFTEEEWDSYRHDG